MQNGRTNARRLLAVTVAALVTACISIGAQTGAKAAENVVTMAEYRQTVPDRIEFVIDGQTFDVPVALPDADTLPVVVTQMATFDATDIRKTYPLEKGLPRYVAIASTAYDYKGSPVLDLCLGKEDRLEGKTDVSDRAALPEGSVPPLNDTTPEEILAFIRRNLQTFDCDTEPNLRIRKATAMSGLCKIKKVKATDGSGARWTEYAPDDTRPVKGAEKGSWELDIAQYMHGARILDGYLPYGQYNLPANPNEWYSHYQIYAHYLDAQNFTIMLCLARETGTVQANAVLLPWDGVVKSIQKRIDEGNLKSIYALELGYSVKIAKGDRFWEEGMKTNLHCRYVLVPEWRILGYDLKDKNSTNLPGFAQPCREAVLDPAHYSRYGLIFELRMDAATGKPVLDYGAMEYTLAD